MISPILELWHFFLIYELFFSLPESLLSTYTKNILSNLIYLSIHYLLYLYINYYIYLFSYLYIITFLYMSFSLCQFVPANRCSDENRYACFFVCLFA